jgi:hypothetical protein
MQRLRSKQISLILAKRYTVTNTTSLTATMIPCSTKRSPDGEPNNKVHQQTRREKVKAKENGTTASDRKGCANTAASQCGESAPQRNRQQFDRHDTGVEHSVTKHQPCLAENIEPRVKHVRFICTLKLLPCTLKTIVRQQENNPVKGSRLDANRTPNIEHTKQDDSASQPRRAHIDTETHCTTQLSIDKPTRPTISTLVIRKCKHTLTHQAGTISMSKQINTNC